MSQMAAFCLEKIAYLSVGRQQVDHAPRSDFNLRDGRADFESRSGEDEALERGGVSLGTHAQTVAEDAGSKVGGDAAAHGVAHDEAGEGWEVLQSPVPY